jgi:hypothetical protein
MDSLKTSTPTCGLGCPTWWAQDEIVISKQMQLGPEMPRTAAKIGLGIWLPATVIVLFSARHLMRRGTSSSTERTKMSVSPSMIPRRGSSLPWQRGP